MNSLKDFFRPEFINRLDEIILFNILSPEAMKDIVKMQVEIVAKRLADKNISLTLSDAALDHLGREGYNPQYGARPLKRLIQTKILTPVANMMVARGVLDGGSIKVDFIPSAESGASGEFKFDVRKGPERVHSVRARAAARA
jgi:ATP-dependent Clp protease ATP-binding subunit ClpB